MAMLAMLGNNMTGKTLNIISDTSHTHTYTHTWVHIQNILQHQEVYKDNTI